MNKDLYKDNIQPSDLEYDWDADYELNRFVCSIYHIIYHIISYNQYCKGCKKVENYFISRTRWSLNLYFIKHSHPRLQDHAVKCIHHITC